MKKFLFYILICFLFSTCVYCPAPPDCFVNNQTGKDITIIVHLDTSVSNHYDKGRIIWWNLKYFTYENEACSEVSIDTLKLIGVYKLKDGKTVSIDGGWAKKAPSTMYDYLEIRTFKDTIIFASAKAIEDEFVSRGFNSDMYDLTVK
jgi:hypothetical protein